MAERQENFGDPSSAVTKVLQDVNPSVDQTASRCRLMGSLTSVCVCVLATGAFILPSRTSGTWPPACAWMRVCACLHVCEHTVCVCIRARSRAEWSDALERCRVHRRDAP